MLKFLMGRIPQDANKPQILLIDANPDIRTVTSLWLETRGFGATLEAASADAGLSLARRHRPAAILLDLQLPDMRGEIALHLLKADPWTRGIPVILFTAPQKKQWLETLPVAGIVLKPFQPEYLCEIVRRALSTNAQEWNGLKSTCPATYGLSSDFALSHLALTNA